MCEVQSGLLELVASPVDEALGFETSASHLAVEVSRVEPGSWAQRMRLRMGDHFVSIDGVPVGSYTGTSPRGGHSKPQAGHAAALPKARASGAGRGEAS